MVVRRSDARRRRLVVDPSQPVVQTDAGTSAQNKTSPKSASKKSDADRQKAYYSYGADRRNHHKTTDLVPKRVVSYLLVVLAILVALALINFGAVNASGWEQQIGSEGIRSFAIDGQGSIACWFSSFLLIMTGLASLQIYALRKHRCDDYRGTYRLWLWMAGLFLLASVNYVVNFGEAITFAFQSFTNQSLTANPWLLFGIKTVALTILVGRGVFEVRESRGSLAWVVLVWLAYTVAALVQFPAARELLVEVGPEMIIGNCILVGTISVFMAHLTYARFIFLQAHGLITIAEKKKKKVVKKKAKPRKKAKAKSSTKKLRSTVAAEDSESAESAESTGSAKRSKPAASSKSKPKAKSTKAKSAPKKSIKIADEPNEEAASPTPAKSKKAERKAKASKQPVKILADSESEKKKSNIGGGLGGGKKSAQDVLKELAAASRAKEQSSQQADYEEDEPEHEGVINLSKAQRRKLRKAQRAKKRAA